jgi:hypothetical protein
MYTKDCGLERPQVIFFKHMRLPQKERNIFERKVYRRILGPEYENEKENWRMLTNKEGARGGVVFKALRYKPAGRGFDS